MDKDMMVKLIKDWSYIDHNKAQSVIGVEDLMEALFESGVLDDEDSSLLID